MRLSRFPFRLRKFNKLEWVCLIDRFKRLTWFEAVWVGLCLGILFGVMTISKANDVAVPIAVFVIIPRESWVS